MRRKGIIAAVIAVILLLACAAALPFLTGSYLIIGGQVYPANVRQLDLSGKPLEDIDTLTRLTQLRSLDLRDTGLTIEDYTALKQALPECRILWLVPFQGQYLPEDSASVTLSSLSGEDLDTLAFFPQLEEIDATACTDADQILALRERYPQCTVTCQLSLDGTTLNQDSTWAVLHSIDSITTALTFFPQLEEIDASQCGDTAALQALQLQYPQCTFLYNLPIGQEEYPNSTETLELQSVSGADLTEILPYFSNLTSVTIDTPVTDKENLLALEQAYPHITFTYSFDLLGVTVSNRDTFIELSDIPLENTEAIEAAMPYFHCLEKVDMCNCGISNEDMAALNQRYPDTLFVWIVKIGPYISTRTDVTYFMPRKYGRTLDDTTTENLKYLTELICLDMGHQKITNTDFLATMTKMQYLILGDTQVSDISGCANMPDLKFAEFFLTEIRDYSPLLACTKLEDVNISYTYPPNWEVFCQMTQLQRLWWRGMYSTERHNTLKEALPNTAMMFSHGSSTGDGWRQSPNYYAMRDILEMSYMTY